MEHTITDIIIYPVKSLGGIHLESSMAGGQGLRHDRNWMLVDVDGVAITQRQIPGLSLFRVGITKGGFSVSHPDEPIPLFLDAEMPASGTRQVKLFNDTMQAAATGVEANEWFSDLLHTSCSLVQATATMHRRVDPQFAFDGETTAFPDGFPVLVIGEASLADLNSRLA